MFELPNATPATIVAVTPRVEKHGEDPVPALSITLEMTVANTMLERIGKGLLGAFYKADKSQPSLEGIETILTQLRFPVLIDSIKFIGELVGWKAVFEHGIGDDSAIRLGQCKVDAFQVTELAEGGTIKLRFRIGTASQDQASAGWLMMRVGEDVTVQLLAPEEKQAPVADDGKAAKKKLKAVEPSVTDIFAASKQAELGSTAPGAAH